MKAVFDVARSLQGGSLDQSQVDALNAILAAWKTYGDGDDRKLSYILATAQHESGFKPVSENLNYTTAERIHKVWPKRFPTVLSAQPYVKKPQKLANLVYGGKLGNTEPNDGWDYRGRGFVQLTGKANYAKFSPLVAYDLVETPDFAKSIEPAARILVIGMMKGMFTGKPLGSYINATLSDFFNARSVVNGDKTRLEGKVTVGTKIANVAQKFLDALNVTPVSVPSTGHLGPKEDKVEIEDEDPVPQPMSPETQKRSLWFVVGAAIIAGVVFIAMSFLKGQ